MRKNLKKRIEERRRAEIKGKLSTLLDTWRRNFERQSQQRHLWRTNIKPRQDTQLANRSEERVE